MTTIHTIKLKISNCFLIEGTKKDSGGYRKSGRGKKDHAGAKKAWSRLG
jgi:hypothetical protein